MTTYSSFRSSILEKHNLADKFLCQQDYVAITEDYEVYVNSELIAVCENLEEARAYARNYIKNTQIIENVDSHIPEEKIVSLIKKYHNIDKITSTLVESYKDLASSNLFTIDPVISNLKHSEISGKYTYTLEDNSTVAINDETLELLTHLLEDKYQIIEFMRKNKDNFMHTIRTLREEQ